MKKSFQRVIATLNLFQGKQSLTIFMLAAFFALWGCDDSSSASGDNNETSAVESSSSVRDSDSTEESSSSIDKKSSGNETKDKSSSSENKSSSSIKETKNSSDSKSSSSVKSDDSSSSLSICPPEKEGKTKMVAFTGVTYICTDGYWIEVSSSSAASSSSYFDMTNQFNSDIKYGTHTDSRDGVTYKTITIKYGYYGVDSLTFFAENLNFGKMVQSSEQQGDSTKYCYDNDPWYCEHGFGGLYSWNTVMKFPAACNNASIGSDDCPSNYDYPKGSLSKHDVFHKGICDEGWHVMHEGEWALLWERAGISSVASAHGSYVFVLKPTYFGLNKSGFSILPAGRFVPSEGGFSDLGEGARFWRPEQDEENSQKASFIYVPRLGDDFSLQRVAVKENAYSVRCVKDYKPEN
ncbi:FISUMP domain-containing protein [Hallerella succinigenes]|uniref:Uncharacterized protein (TIGR02145 family) n=1 Tax=Hallerella succinigenes TaxID=1896222 RepID=A0A2M9A9I3_9BACT|nr:FISUMP domain-containing protein [Hallerella succinigenes]PJJ42283.1 uncharacterized protein (TIGR02145 family) [Hallerella succinigenes]